MAGRYEVLEGGMKQSEVALWMGRKGDATRTRPGVCMGLPRGEFLAAALSMVYANWVGHSVEMQT